MNTAQLRSLARDAEKSLEWRKAAELYQQALDVYPACRGGLSDLDKDHLRHKARSCRTMVVHSEHLCA